MNPAAYKLCLIRFFGMSLAFDRPGLTSGSGRGRGGGFEVLQVSTEESGHGRSRLVHGTRSDVEVDLPKHPRNWNVISPAAACCHSLS
jgi:hypothetical protein